ncbi:hypothetical protein [Streptomyces sp. NPDC094472]|uniref:hypothetical protein n=1 Tax=unclassified Streptomyces TaxID=2593676 RepID=UPI00331A8A2F
MSAKVVRLVFGRIGSSQLYVHRCGEPPVESATRVEPGNCTATGTESVRGGADEPPDLGTSDDLRELASGERCPIGMHADP